MTPLEEEKYKLRKKMEKARDAIGAEESEKKSKQACEHVLAHSILTQRPMDKPLTICTYMPFRSELNIAPVMEWCWEQNIRVLVPRAHRLTRTLHIHAIKSYNDLETGAWGIREPKHNAPSWELDSPIDLMIIPGLAFDVRGGRLGYGGGYYDSFVRSFQRVFQRKQWKSPLLMSVAFDLQVVDHVPMERHDFKIDVIITESGTINTEED